MYTRFLVLVDVTMPLVTHGLAASLLSFPDNLTRGGGCRVLLQNVKILEF